MATAQDTLKTIVRMEGAEHYLSSLRQIGNAADATAMKQQRLAQSYTRASLAMTAMAVPLVGVAAGMIRTAGKMEQVGIALETLIGDADRAKKMLAELGQFAATTPFEFIGLAAAAQKMLAFGFTAQEVIPTLRSIGDAVSALGAGQDTINRVILAFGQMRAKGRIMGQEMLQLAEAGIPVYRILREELGLTGEEMRRVGERGIDAEVGIKAVLKGLDKTFGGGMERQTGTLNQALSNLVDQLGLTSAAIGSGFIPEVVGMTKAMTRLAAIVGMADEADKKLLAGILKFAVVGTVVAAITLRMKAFGLQWAANRAIVTAGSVETQAALTAETVKVREGVVAYNELAAAKARAAGTIGGMNLFQSGWASGRPTSGSGGGLSGLFAKGSTGQVVQQIVAISMAASAIAELGDATTDTADKIGSAGKAAGYVAGAFNPLILIATLLGDAIGRLIDYITDKQQQASNRGSEQTPGFAEGKLLSREEIRRQYAAEPAGVRESISEEEYIRNAQMVTGPAAARSAAALRAKEARKAQAEKAANAFEIGGMIGQKRAADTSLARAQLGQVEDSARTPQETIRNYQQTLQATEKLQAALRAEAEIHRMLAGGMEAEARRTNDQTERMKLETKARQERVAAALNEIDATKAGQKAMDDYAKAQERLDKEVKRAARERAAEEKRARDERMSTASNYVKVVETMYGKESAQAKQAHRDLSQLLSVEALQARQVGDMARAYSLAAAAVDEMRASQDDLAKSMQKSLDVGSAYVGYLRAIGKEKEAEQYERTRQASGLAGLANKLFAQGDIAGGYRAAAEAEKSARSGMTGGSDLFKGGSYTPYAGQQLTSALGPGAWQRGGGPPVNVQVQVRDEEGNMRRVSKQVLRQGNRENYYQIHAQ